ncbi:MAG TPA: glycoside hydrolase family 2 TIM barrel-domain containing protein [Isosphaeraceae bacterium]|jgi:hypothetical protein|nr:glycoside hydrolase family 2 TIM barrel-domain containing protein [Isosphaeraceae bacterium]
MIRTTIARSMAWLALAWAAAAVAADIPRPEHPTPDAVRPHWANLNGRWGFRFDPRDEGRDARWFEPAAPGFDRTIVVPFPWESELSGVHELKGPKVGWYRRTFRVPDDFPKGQRVWLRFGAVDWRADVWVNGKHVAAHEGGYTPFEADITDALKADGDNTLVVRAFDPTDPSLPTGKQVGWYTPTSGIWQTVWLEARPVAYIKQFTVKTSIDPAGVTVEFELEGLEPRKPYGVGALPDDRSAPMTVPGVLQILADKPGRYPARSTVTQRVRDPKVWTPDEPTLYPLTLELASPDGQVDTIRTYFGLRTIARGKYGNEPFERLLLNGKPIYLRAALDQSFNPKGIYTAPSDAFLKHDIELAKSFGLNGLRIHIKPDEPRRLYWADKLGMLILEDMPNTWEQNEKARKAWEATMREAVARDRNHPAIVAWVDFNETWGLGRPDHYKASKETQDWVKRMVALTRTLDPTRLVEDNSPCNYDHVEGTDLNSWHFYIDDHEGARKHIDEVVARSTPGSPFNYCPGQAMNSAPLINSEYGSVSAGGGDRDVSWGFRDLTTLLRKQNKVQGYVYTELDDIEWEHNGFVNYDRTAKAFGYDAFVPGMTVADLQGPDFVGYDAPPAIEAKVGETVKVPVFVSHFSDRKAARLRWWVAGFDDHGRRISTEPTTVPVSWTPYDVTMQQEPLTARLDRGFVGAIAMVLEDEAGKKVAANFVNLVVRPERPLAHVERLDDRKVALRFAPEDFAKGRWSGPTAGEGKAAGQGKGSFTYSLKLPKAVVDAKPESIELMVEAASKAGRERVDWPERVNPQDNPQTDERKWPSTLEVSIDGQRVARVDLPDDPADARGVLSHLARVDHGSYGELLRIKADLPDPVKADLASGKPLELRLAVPDDAEHAGGLRVFGAGNGAYPVDPTLVVTTANRLPADLGVKADESVAIDVKSSRRTWLLAPGDNPRGSMTRWAYTTAEPGASWAEPGFDDSKWRHAAPGFGTDGTPGVAVHTHWDSSTIWLRAVVDVPRLGAEDALSLHVYHDEDVDVFVNGRPLFRARGFVTSYRDVPLDDAQKGLFLPGPNTIAVRCRQTGGGQGIDVGLGLTKGE